MIPRHDPFRLEDHADTVVDKAVDDGPHLVVQLSAGTLEEGESCGAANTRCAAGTECTGGRCVATDELTIFAQLCGSP